MPSVDTPDATSRLQLRKHRPNTVRKFTPRINAGTGLTFDIPAPRRLVAQAYWSGHYTLAQVGKYFGVSYATVSRAVKQAEGSG